MVGVMFKGTLYPFQKEASQRMVDKGQMLLAMVMGAGKTVTTISALEELIESNEVDRVLVVVPSSLKYQWLREIKKFTDSTAVVIDGTPKQRESLWRTATRCRYVIVNPECLINDSDQALSVKANALVVDEATMIKSPRAKRSRLLKRLGKKFHYRFALTGQPIENRPEELFSIMEFVDPSVLGRFDVFDRTFIVRNHFGAPVRYRNLQALNESLSEVMVRKTREDIADQLPKVIHQVIPVPFDKPGATAYERISKDLVAEINKAITQHGRGFDLWRTTTVPQETMRRVRLWLALQCFACFAIILGWSLTVRKRMMTQPRQTGVSTPPTLSRRVGFPRPLRHPN